MDLQSLAYFSELCKDLHFTRTAQRLYISQQTLSNHIKRLEEELGAPLLERRPTLALTCAGEYVRAFAQQVGQENTNLQDILFDVSRQERGLLKLGASMPRANTFLPQVLPLFLKEYPKVEVRLTDGISSRLEGQVASGDLDLAVVLAEEAPKELAVHHLLDDTVYLCVSDRLLRNHYGAEAQALKERSLHGARVEEFARLPFCMLSNRLGGEIRRCFEAAGCRIQPRFTATYSYLAVSLCAQGVGACFTTQMNLVGQRRELGEDVNIFPILYQGAPVTQELSLIRQKDRYLARYAWRFLELTFQWFADMERMDLARMV